MIVSRNSFCFQLAPGCFKLNLFNNFCNSNFCNSFKLNFEPKLRVINLQNSGNIVLLDNYFLDLFNDLFTEVKT